MNDPLIIILTLLLVTLLYFVHLYTQNRDLLNKNLLIAKKVRLIDKLSIEEYLSWLSSRLKFAVQLTYLNENVSGVSDLHDVRFHAVVLAKFLESVSTKVITEHESVFGEGTLSPYIMDVLQLWSANGVLASYAKELEIN